MLLPRVRISGRIWRSYRWRKRCAFGDKEGGGGTFYVGGLRPYSKTRQGRCPCTPQKEVTPFGIPAPILRMQNWSELCFGSKAVIKKVLSGVPRSSASLLFLPSSFQNGFGLAVSAFLQNFLLLYLLIFSVFILNTFLKVYCKKHNKITYSCF